MCAIQKIHATSIRRTIGKIKKKETENVVKRTETYVLKRGTEETAEKNDENRRSTRRNCKRLRSPGIGERNAPEPKRIKSIKTPVLKNQIISNDKTPCSAKKILVGIEKSLSKAKSALTPRRKNNFTESVQPAILWGKDLCNVSTTTSDSPDEILMELQSALKAKGIICTKKGLVHSIITQ